MNQQISVDEVATEQVGGKVQQARVTAYIPHEVKEWLECMAEAEERTLSNFVALILKRYVENVLSENDSGNGDRNSDDSEE